MFLAKRRAFLKTGFYAGISALCGGLSKMSSAAWSANHFSPSPYSEILSRLFNDKTITASDLLTIKLPETAENGAVVPITISSDLDNIQRLYILVEKNPTPLAAEFTLSGELAVYLTARIKMAESCHVVVIAEQGELLLRNQQWVNVVLGGCGTG